MEPLADVTHSLSGLALELSLDDLPVHVLVGPPLRIAKATNIYVQETLMGSGTTGFNTRCRSAVCQNLVFFRNLSTDVESSMRNDPDFHLPLLFQELIFNQLTNVHDLLGVSAVCTSWRRVVQYGTYI